MTNGKSYLDAMNLSKSKTLSSPKFVSIALITALISLGAGLYWPFSGQSSKAVSVANLYRPASPTTIWGAKSGKIGHTPIETYLINLEDVGCSICPRDGATCWQCGLQHNTAGVYCFANGLYRRAARHFEKSYEIEKAYEDTPKPFEKPFTTTWINLKFYKDIEQNPVVQADLESHLSHSQRLSGYKRNLELSQSESKHQKKFFEPTLFFGSDCKSSSLAIHWNQD